MLQRCLITCALITTATAASAQELELTLNDDLAEGVIAQRSASDNGQSSRYGGGLLFNDASDLVGSLFLHVNNEIEGQWQPWTLGVGGKLYGADLDRSSETVAALALGGTARVGIPTEIPLAVTGSAHISPNITTSGDADRVTELQLRLEAEVVRGADVYLGYRYLQFDMDNARDEEVDDSLHAGLRLQF